MARKKSARNTEEKRPDAKTEERKAIQHARNRAKDAKADMYVFRSDRWYDVYYVSPYSTHHNSTLVKEIEYNE